MIILEEIAQIWEKMGTGEVSIEISHEDYQYYWKRVKERTALEMCFNNALSLSFMTIVHHTRVTMAKWKLSLLQPMHPMENASSLMDWVVSPYLQRRWKRRRFGTLYQRAWRLARMASLHGMGRKLRQLQVFAQLLASLVHRSRDSVQQK